MLASSLPPYLPPHDHLIHKLENGDGIRSWTPPSTPAPPQFSTQLEQAVDLTNYFVNICSINMHKYFQSKMEGKMSI